MIRIMAVTKDEEVLQDISIEDARGENIKWYWVDMNELTLKEMSLLIDDFQFHSLAVEDCLEGEKHPKIDEYDGYWFLILSQLNVETYKSEELNIFIGKKFLVSFHRKKIDELERIWEQFPQKNRDHQHPVNLLHHIIDALVDQYFRPLYKIENNLPELNRGMSNKDLKKTMDDVYEIREELSKLRKIILPMRDVVYRLVYMDNYETVNENKYYFKDSYNHLAQLVSMMDSNDEITADIRDNYYSLNSEHTNNIIKTLTIISAFFLPLTFIIGLEGVEAIQAPTVIEGYEHIFLILLMAGATAGMFMFFKKKGWFDK